LKYATSTKSDQKYGEKVDRRKKVDGGRTKKPPNIHTMPCPFLAAHLS